MFWIFIFAEHFAKVLPRDDLIESSQPYKVDLITVISAVS